MLAAADAALEDEPETGFRRFLEAVVAMLAADRSLFDALDGRVPPDDGLRAEGATSLAVPSPTPERFLASRRPTPT